MIINTNKEYIILFGELLKLEKTKKVFSLSLKIEPDIFYTGVLSAITLSNFVIENQRLCIVDEKTGDTILLFFVDQIARLTKSISYENYKILEQNKKIIEFRNGEKMENLPRISTTWKKQLKIKIIK